jgi:hypothetical protein
MEPELGLKIIGLCGAGYLMYLIVSSLVKEHTKTKAIEEFIVENPSVDTQFPSYCKHGWSRDVDYCYFCSGLDSFRRDCLDVDMPIEDVVEKWRDRLPKKPNYGAPMWSISLGNDDTVDLVSSGTIVFDSNSGVEHFEIGEHGQLIPKK